MTKPFPIPADISDQAQEYYQLHGHPLLRDPNERDEVLYLSWSDGQDVPVLLSEPHVSADEYTEAAQVAALSIPHRIPDFVLHDGTIVAISLGFYDLNGDYWDELTFNSCWQATLLQYWLDHNNCGICISLPDGQQQDIKNDQLCYEHACAAQYTIDNSIRHASMQHMGMRQEIYQYVAHYFACNKTLPIGTHLIRNMKVTFPLTFMEDRSV